MFNGRKEEIWFTSNEGMMGAYDLKEWFLGLPSKYQTKLLKINNEVAKTTNGMMQSWRKKELIEGPYEVHRPIIDKYLSAYTDVPPLLKQLFDLTKKRDYELCQLVLDEWIDRATRSDSDEALFDVLSTAIELYWDKGYSGAKTIRELGIHNAELQQIEKYALYIVGLFRNRKLSVDMSSCKPLDRLLLLYKLSGKKEVALDLIDDLERSGYGHLFEIRAYKNEFSK
ncbi:hypothetical protein CEK71_13560 [Methylovulum psychrotolerans]|uniref:Uncharacterized protein n=2 Tax=Methylovulum psychrotolerans TaxID=1704499 RepID=A0A1Z4C0G1_9GAMM|nr:hypothetical protein CEK71_13560 [Methylovulum psychrotolerans]